MFFYLLFTFVFLLSIFSFISGVEVIDFYQRTPKIRNLQNGKIKQINWSMYSFSKEVDITGNTELHWLVCVDDTWKSFYSEYLSLTYEKKKKLLSSIRVLLKFVNEDGETPILFAAGCSNTEAVTFFLENNIGYEAKNNLEENLWFYAIYFNNLELFKILQNFKVPLINDVFENNIWHKVARYGNKETWNYLNKSNIVGIEVINAKQATPLHLAAFYKNEIALYFLDNLLEDMQFNINQQDLKGNSILYYTCQSENYDLAKKMIQAGADVNQQNYLGLNCLHWSLYSKDTLLYNLLSRHNIKLDVVDKSGKNILVWAMELKNYSLLSKILSSEDFLLEQKTYKEGANPFFWVIAKKDKRAFDILLPYVKNLDEQDKEQNTALFWCIRKHFLVAAKVLMNKGVDIHHTNLEGNNILHEAARVGFTEIIPLLLKEGARKNIYNLEGLTPLQLALKYGQVHLANYLR